MTFATIHIPSIRQGRSGHKWRTAQAQVFATETDCWLCGAYVDQTLPYNDRMARSVDHVVPMSAGGDPLARSNLRLAHRQCNGAKGYGTAIEAAPTRNPSRRWS
jgi:5-methylcytosine-specific restriction endonuclease McrA